ncbi:ATP-grasp domain-containing protein [Anaeromyxobacter paludicola]|uniref:Phosphoribosylglycinamide synthetase n=1 Tax=Anaeromyxobacter paludicola TaxID=2918171 RepID=A0ABM7X5W0_9BACT|nr:ATP-grasp domain-containing protein [Anaeromyxobacter paludicola]BDG07201.1 phosphoribosylglycinamide synthetase [Anaeromyxobacter paludicola]
MTAPRLLLLAPTQSYRTDDFLAAAARLGVPVVVGTDRCHRIEETFGEEQGLWSLDYRKPEHAAEQIAAAARQEPIAGIVPVNETTAVIAALAAERLGLPWNPPDAALRAADKAAQRTRLAEAGLPVPAFRAFRLDGDPEAAAASVTYPCVLKPVVLSASRGVIRADDPAGFVAAWRRIERILREARTERRAAGAEAARTVLVEAFVPGAEVAVEGLLRGGAFELLALFDKPDPLDGPYFEETLYVTPSRHPAPLQREIARLTGEACRALGLREGPVHAELRLPPAGPVILEVAARSIGGLCARTLRFGAGISLEELLVCHALRLPLASLQRERRAAGVMMIPIPRAGILHGVGGLDEAKAVPGVEDVVVTAQEGREVAPLPEGDCYFGFIFARGEAPAEVEAALRAAHARLRIDIRAPLPMV